MTFKFFAFIQQKISPFEKQFFTRILDSQKKKIVLIPSKKPEKLLNLRGEYF